MKSRLASLLLTALGCLLVLWSVGLPLLGLVGERTLGQIITVRRQGGERDESIPNRYAYAIGFQFTLPDGQVIFGSSTRVGNSWQVYGLPDVAAAPIRYLRAAPMISALEADTRPSWEQAVVLAVGWVLIFRHRLGRQERKRCRSASQSR